jgi:hypothetical protein
MSLLNRITSHDGKEMQIEVGHFRIQNFLLNYGFLKVG